MANKFQSKVEFFQNKGLYLKEEASQIPDSAFSELTNLISVQEGSLSVRQGDQRLTSPASYQYGGFQTVSLIHTIEKLHGPSTGDARYIGEGTAIWRSTTANPFAPPATMVFNKVALNAASNSATSYIQLRHTGIPYNAGTIGTPYEFFACPTKMLKDNGSFNTNPGDQSLATYGSGTDGTLLQKWGILPPYIPAITALDAISVLPTNTDVIGGVTTGDRINVTTSAFAWNTSSGSGPGQITIQPSAIISSTNLIQQGTLLVIATGGGNVTMRVNYVTTSDSNFGNNPTFTGYLGTSSNPTISGAITAALVTETAPNAVPNIPANIDASFNGVPQDGYVTNDLVHVAISLDDPTKFTDIRFRVFVGGTGGDGSGSDYYEAAISPSALQSAISGTATMASTLPGVLNNTNLGVYTDTVQNLTDITGSATYISQLSPTSPLSSTSTVWTEIDIPKHNFTAVGNAGDANKTWKNVTGFQVAYTVLALATPTISVSSAYICGGYGPNSTNLFVNTPQLFPYSYCYTFRNVSTGAESNPSVPQISKNAVYPTNQQIAISCTGTGDPQIYTSAGATSIVIYRAGGSFADGYYRQVGFATNPGYNSKVTYLDSATDESIASNPVVQFDNDPPITSSLPTPITAQIVSFSPSSVAGGFTYGLTLSGVTGTLSSVTVGSTVSIYSGNNINSTNFETAIVQAVVGFSQINVYIQYAHAVGDTVAINAATNQPCNLGVAAFESIFLAGDPNNPAVLYKSKTGRPEAFPVVELATGNPGQINVGSPSDPIMNVTEFNNQIVCLNLSHIYVINVFAGAMQAPIQTPANRGLLGTYAWCKADNEIWYLSYDGIYSWNGGQSVKRSEAIDPIFKGYSIGVTGNNFVPIDMSKASFITMAYYQNDIIVTYVDTQSVYHRLRYNIPFNRWWREDIYDALNTPPTSPVTMTAQYVEPDTGNLLFAKAFSFIGTTWAFLYLDNIGTTDGWLTVQNDGAHIGFACTPASYDLGLPSIQKQFSDYMLEMYNWIPASSTSTPILVQNYYDFSTSPLESPIVGVLGPSSRWRAIVNILGGFGNEAYALTLRISGFSNSPTIFYSLTFNYFSLDQLQSGRAFDWDDGGTPDDKRLTELVVWYDAKAASEVWCIDIISGITNSQTVITNVQQFTLTPLSGTFTGPSWTQVTFPIADGIVAKKMRFRPLNAPAGNYIVRDCKFSFDKYPADIVNFTDYSVYEWPYDKHFFVLWMNVDTNGFTVTVNIEADGNVAQTVQVAGTASNRSIPIGINVDIIGKLLRLHVTNIPSGGKFQLFDHHFDFEKFPADIVLNTEYRDFNYPFLKYAQQLVLDINTNNQIVPIQVVGDGVVLQTVNVQSTIQTRDQRFTLNPIRDGAGVPIASSKYRLVINSASIPATGRVQLWTWDIVYEKADRGPVHHSFDWDYMDWPYDKKLIEVTIEYNTGGVATTVLMDTMTGVKGETINVAAFSFVLDGSGRSLQTFPFPDYTYVKQVRLYPRTENTTFLQWGYKFKAENQPADITEFTEWNDMGWPCEKIARNLILDIDTGGVTGLVQVLGNGDQLIAQFSPTTTDLGRHFQAAFASDGISTMFRLGMQPGSGGKMQLYDWKIDYVKLPCSVSYYDSYETTFGVTNWKFIKQGWFHYNSTAPITLSIYTIAPGAGTQATKQLFYQYTLPTQPVREVQRMYFPSSLNGVLNKSKTYRIVMQTSGVFQMYADSRIDFGIFGQDQMGCFELAPTSAEMELPVAPLVVGSAKS